MTPLRVLFWNLGSAASPSVVSALAAEHEPDIIVLVESDHGIAVTVEEINIRTGPRYEIPFTLPGAFSFSPGYRVIVLLWLGTSLSYTQQAFGRRGKATFRTRG